jgi:ArsR family transcriptional regulator
MVSPIDIPTDKQLVNLVNLYKMFADSTRLKVLWALSIESMCVGSLSAALGMTESAISHQLKTLRLAGLVKYDKKGKFVHYSLSDDNVREMIMLWRV